MSKQYLIKSRKALVGLETEISKFEAASVRIDFLRGEADSERMAWEKTGDPASLQRAAALGAEVEAMQKAMGDFSEIETQIRDRFFAEPGVWEVLSREAQEIVSEFQGRVRAVEARTAETVSAFIRRGGDPAKFLLNPRNLQDEFFMIDTCLEGLRAMRVRLQNVSALLASLAETVKEPSRRSEKNWLEAKDRFEGLAQENSVE